ncbi:MAG: RDD family protein [Methanosarcina sp.]
MQAYSSFFKRLVASTIDISVIILFISFIQFFTGPLTGSFPYILVFFMAYIYFVFQESSILRGTIGKQAMNLIVTDLTGNKISFYKATKRFIWKFIAAIPFFTGYFLILFTGKKQALYDIMVETVVCLQED